MLLFIFTYKFLLYKRCYINTVVGWIVSSQNLYVAVLNTQYLTCGLIWRWGLYMGIQVRVRWLGSAIIQYDYYFIKRGIYIQTSVEGRWCEEHKKTQEEHRHLLAKKTGPNRALPHNPEKGTMVPRSQEDDPFLFLKPLCGTL